MAKSRIISNAVAAWRAVSDTPLSTIEDTLHHCFDCSVSPSLKVLSEGVFKISLELVRDGYKTEPSFIVDFQRGAIRDGDIFVPPDMRGNKIGPSFLKSQIRIGEECGLSKVVFTVAGDLGAYVWSKANIQPTNDTLPPLRFYLRERFRHIAKHLANDDQRDALEECCHLSRCDDLQRIAAFEDLLDKPAQQTFLSMMEPQDARLSIDARTLLIPNLPVAKFMLARQWFDVEHELAPFSEQGHSTQSQPHAARSLSPASQRAHPL